ncbi:MAG: Deoxyribodipyrimidine photo-lyase [Pseudomonadales bacterium]|nr:Deoxyribodipyrimidine photo-lyase [Pseudomonadales bacterium]
MNLVWFRCDLRVDDHAALAAACAHTGPVAGVFVLSPAQWRAHDWGARKQSFVWHHVLALRERLAALGIPLSVLHVERWSDTPAALRAFAQANTVHCVHANAEYAVDERLRDRRTAKALREAGIGWELHHDLTLIPPGTLRTRSGAPFRVFGAFRRAWLERARSAPPRTHAAPAPRAPVTPPPLPDWEPPHCDLDRHWWPIGEDAAHARLAAFVDQHLDRYHEDRDVPALDGTSRLSPYLASGVLSVRRCFAAALVHNHGEWDSGSPGAQTWITELVWREFYTHLLADFPQIARHRALRPETEAVPWRAPGEDFTRWCEGLTGFPLVDAGMRQLRTTGWMHNRLRMLCAMFLGKHLLIDWRHGERFFCEQLVDCELAANNGGWQWSASTGTDAAPYFRVLSPVAQAGRFDPDGVFVRRYVPELAQVPAAALLRPGHPQLLAAGYPAPMVDLKAARERVLQAFRGLGASPPAEPPP